MEDTVNILSKFLIENNAPSEVILKFMEMDEEACKYNQLNK